MFESRSNLYVAFSRIKSLENLLLIGTYTAHAIKQNVAEKLEYKLLINNQVKVLAKLMISDFSFSI